MVGYCSCYYMTTTSLKASSVIYICAALLRTVQYYYFSTTFTPKLLKMYMLLALHWPLLSIYPGEMKEKYCYHSTNSRVAKFWVAGGKIMISRFILINFNVFPEFFEQTIINIYQKLCVKNGNKFYNICQKMRQIIFFIRFCSKRLLLWKN